MRIVVTAEGAGLEAPASRVFGRCHYYVFVETDSMGVESVENPAIDSSSGAGIEAAQFVVEGGAEAVVTGNVGPNAFSVLEASGVPVYLLDGGSVRDVVNAHIEGRLAETSGASGPAHAGMGRGHRANLGRRGLGGRRGSGAAPERLSPPQASDAGLTKRRETEISQLQDMAVGLRKQLAEVIERLDQLDKEV